MTNRHSAIALAFPLLFALGCSDPNSSGDTGPNPFLEDQADDGKGDTAFLNPDGIEVEVDLEADVKGSASQILKSPAFLGQFATTYLRKRGEFYLESLAEDTTSKDRVEWLVDDQWITAEEAESVPSASLTHFRIRGVNAVLLHDARDGVEVGSVFEAEVPINPFTVMRDAGDDCADPDDHMDLDQSIYWYQWNPDRRGCTLETQNMTLTVSEMFSEAQQTYPEYDQLVEDGKVTAVVLFGQIGDGPIDDREDGVRNLKEMAGWLADGGFREITPAPVGRRFSKRTGTVDFEIDLYSPNDFSGLSDLENFPNFQRAIGEHEIVVYDGHSMLGASDFWARPDYPETYQIYIYGGCLGYEYYVQPVLAGKGGDWSNLDLVSSVVEVTADANMIAGPVFAKLAWSFSHGYKVSWRSLLLSVRNSVGDSTFGASGVRDNCYSPYGSLCE